MWYRCFRDTGYLPFLFKGYEIKCSMFCYFHGHWIFRKNIYRDIYQFTIRDTCQFTSRDIGNPLPLQASFMAQLNCILDQLLKFDLYSIAMHIHSKFDMEPMQTMHSNSSQSIVVVIAFESNEG